MNYTAEQYKSDHAVRFQRSLEWLATLPRPAPLRVLEVGGMGAFTPLYHERFPHDETSATIVDLRYYMDSLGPNPIPTESQFDLVLCMEVLEHINDRDTNGEVVCEFRGSGIASMMQGIWRVLKPGGLLFLTTPNAASITTIHHAMRLAAPALYRPHVREFAPYELDEIVRGYGFSIERRETLDVWRNAIHANAHAAIKRFILEAGYPADLRGEDIFMLARRPV